jgi:hypothetical protein
MGESGPGEISNLFLNFLIGTLNSLLPRFIFFTIPAVGEGLIDSFFGLLNFFDRNAEVF